MTVSLLVITFVLMLVGAGLFVAAFARRESTPALAGMTAMMVAAVPAVVYASVTS